MESPPFSTNKRHLASSCDMDAFPAEIIGNILSHVADARSVALASATCRKWRDASKYYLHRLSFDRSDGEIDELETIITEAVMRTTCLQDLSIFANNERDDVILGRAPVIAWLLHTKQTLTHLTFMARIKSKTNIVLEKLAAGGTGALKCLVWGFEDIPAIDPRIHSLPSLVSLTLCNVTGGVSRRSLHLLLSVCPKLESLTLINVLIDDVASVGEFHFCSLLRALKFDKVRWFQLIVDLLLRHACNLESLSLRRMNLQKLDLGDMEKLQHLEVLSCTVAQLELGNLQSLLHVTLSEVPPRLSQQILSKAGTKLQKLHLWDLWGQYSANMNDMVDVDMIVSSFPGLRWLSLHYEQVCNWSPKQLQKLEQMSVLKLHTSMDNSNPDLFAQWIVGVMECCPNAKQLTIVLGEPTRILRLSDRKFSSRLTSLLISIMRPYAHIDIKIEM